LIPQYNPYADTNHLEYLAMRVMLLTFWALTPLAPLASAAACWERAADRYGVDPGILRSVASVESGFNAAAIHINDNGSRDVGLLQINSQHFSVLNAHGVTEADLYRPCRAQEVGAWVLAHCQKTFGKTWEAVGCYNAGPSKGKRAARLRYARLVKSHYLKRFAPRT
jgi:soluble lytic murein transglycosylase-like protein